MSIRSITEAAASGVIDLDEAVRRLLQERSKIPGPPVSDQFAKPRNPFRYAEKGFIGPGPTVFTAKGGQVHVPATNPWDCAVGPEGKYSYVCVQRHPDGTVRTKNIKVDPAVKKQYNRWYRQKTPDVKKGIETGSIYAPTSKEDALANYDRVKFASHYAGDDLKDWGKRYISPGYDD